MLPGWGCNIYDAPKCIAPIQRTLWAAQNLNALYIIKQRRCRKVIKLINAIYISGHGLLIGNPITPRIFRKLELVLLPCSTVNKLGAMAVRLVMSQSR